MNFGKKIRFFNYRPLVSIFLFLMAGIIFAVGLKVGTLKYLIFSIGVGILFIFTLIIKLLKAKYKKTFKVVSVIIAFVIGFCLTFLILNNYDRKYAVYEGKYFVEGKVCSYSRMSKSGLRIVSLDDVIITNEKTNKTEKPDCEIRIYLNEGDGRTKDFKLGEIVSGVFDIKSADYLRDDEVNFYMINKNVKILGFGEEDDIASTGKIEKNLFDKIKVKLKSSLDRFMTEEYGELGYTMIFGDKSNLYEDMYDSYSASGIAHLLAVSGLHVGFIVTLFGILLSLFKANDKVKFYVMSIIVLLYAFMCGFSVSVTRAMIMTIVLLFSKLRKKKYDSISGLSLAGIIILIWNPLFVFDIGFILSFSAVASIIIFSRTFTNFFSKFFHEKLASSLSVSLSASIGTAFPIMIAFEKLSLFSVVTNMIVIPLASVAYMLMFVFSLMSIIIPALGVFIYMFEVIMRVVTGISQITGAISLAECNQYFVFGFGAMMVVAGIFVSDYFITKRKLKLLTTLISTFSCIVFGILMLIC